MSMDRLKMYKGPGKAQQQREWYRVREDQETEQLAAHVHPPITAHVT